MYRYGPNLLDFYSLLAMGCRGMVSVQHNLVILVLVSVQPISPQSIRGKLLEISVGGDLRSLSNVT